MTSTRWSDWDWSSVAAAVWLAGLVALPAASLAAYLRFLSRLRLRDAKEAEWVREWEGVLAEGRVRSPIPLKMSTDLGPLLCRLPGGYRVVVPERLWEALSPAQRVAILRHEVAHYRRGDLGKSLAVHGLALVHWFNPLAWWAVRRFDECAEWACDDAAAGGERAQAADYARALLQVCEASGHPPLWGAGARGHSLSVRIRRLLAAGRQEDPTMMKNAALLGLFTLLAVAGMVRIDLVAQEPAKGEPHVPSVRRGVDYLIVPVQTEVQRLLVRRPEAKVFVALNGASLRDEDGADVALLEAVRRDLRQSAAKDDAVLFSIFFGDFPERFDPVRLKETLAGIAADLGLKADPSEVEWRNDNDTWQERVAMMEEGLPAQPGVEEAGIGDRSVKAYPVRTLLSRYLTGGADCVVDILEPLAGDGDEETCGVIRSGVSKLELVRKKHINFRIHLPPDGVDDVAHDQIPAELNRLSKSLGFKGSSVTMLSRPRPIP